MPRIEVEQKPVVVGARAIECEESVDVESSDEHSPAGWQALGYVSSRRYFVHDPPRPSANWQPLDDARYATHVCSRNGMVIPRPTLPAATSQ
jgi:hypothetical protein